jgi:BirA family biotin operon repressor/biotin-[acetyl-CoA-carboxylase] ligase
MPDVIDTARIQETLIPPVAGPVIWAAEVGSTNDLVAMRARAGAAEGLVIGADLQTAGRGRRGRSWAADAGTALLFSVLLRPSRGGRDVGVLPIAAAVGVAEGLAALGITVGLVWPNDISADGKKLGGILCELASTGQELAWAVVGVGLNVRTSPALADARWEPTSVAAVAGRPVPREAVLGAVLRGLGEWFGRWYRDGDAPVIAAFARHDALAGRPIRVAVGDATLTGVADGLDADGALRLVRPDGSVVAVTSAEVTGVDRTGAGGTG